MSVEAVSGSHGFLGEHLMARLSDAIRQGHQGFVPIDVDIMFNLSAYGNLYGQDNIRDIYQANLVNVINAIESLQPSQKYIFVSTSSVKLPQQTYLPSMTKVGRRQ